MNARLQPRSMLPQRLETHVVIKAESKECDETGNEYSYQGDTNPETASA